MSPDDGVNAFPIAKTPRARCDGASSRSDDPHSIASRRIAAPPRLLAPPTRESVGEGPGALHFETHSAKMRHVFARAVRIAPVDMMVLLTGEAGVGKEWLARWIHPHSRQADRPFVRIDCAGLPEGSVDQPFTPPLGAFTGVVPGFFDAAGGGTLFLDDIGDLSPAMQVTLRRVIEERWALGVGDVRRMDVRLIASTARHLGDEMAQRRFRPDLYYCLAEKLHTSARLACPRCSASATSHNECHRPRATRFVWAKTDEILAGVSRFAEPQGALIARTTGPGHGSTLALGSQAACQRVRSIKEENRAMGRAMRRQGPPRSLRRSGTNVGRRRQSAPLTSAAVPHHAVAHDCRLRT